MDSMSEKTLSDTKKTLWKFFWAAVIGMLLTISVYSVWFMCKRVPLSESSEAWGQFGDYFGGILNPVFALAAFAGLLWTIFQNQINLHKTTEAFNKTVELAVAQEARQVKQDKKNDIFKVIEVIDKDIRQCLEMKAKVTQGSFYLPTDIEMSASDVLKKEFEGNEKHWENVKQDFSPIFIKLANSLTMLRKYLSEFESLSDNLYVGEYYKINYYNISDSLCKIGSLDIKISKFYKIRKITFFGEIE